MVGRSSDFPKIRQTSQTINLDIFPTKAITINMNVEHQYNRTASQRYTSFADVSMKWKNQIAFLMRNNVYQSFTVR